MLSPTLFAVLVSFLLLHPVLALPTHGNMAAFARHQHQARRGKHTSSVAASTSTPVPIGAGGDGPSSTASVPTTTPVPVGAGGDGGSSATVEVITSYVYVTSIVTVTAGSEPTAPVSSPGSGTPTTPATPTGHSHSHSASGSASAPVSVSLTSSAPASTSTSGNTGGSGPLSGPVFSIYSDDWLTGGVMPDVSDLAGYNVFILSFLLTAGPVDNAELWVELDSATRQSTKAAYNAAGIKLMVSAFGSTEQPTTAGQDATQVATTMAQWVIDNDLDGIDVDYEDFTAMNAQDGSAEQWLETFTQTLRSMLPEGQYIITHAPVAPWFNAGSYASGAYAKVDQTVGSLIDWYNVQFYNQPGAYLDCPGLLTSSDSTVFPNSALFQISASGVELNKLVIGKPATSADATTGFMDTSTLADCVSQAQAQGWNGGVMTWQYPHADASWIQQVRASAFPVSS